VNRKEVVSGSGMRFPLISRAPVPLLSTAFFKFKSASTCTRVSRMAASPSHAAVGDGAPSASSAIDFLSICHRLKVLIRKRAFYFVM